MSRVYKCIQSSWKMISKLQLPPAKKPLCTPPRRWTRHVMANISRKLAAYPQNHHIQKPSDHQTLTSPDRST
jgi:hypothetical protein